MSEQNFYVQAAPNKSKIQGKIVKIEKDKESMAEIWEVKVEKSFDVEKAPNFTKSRTGNSIKICLPLDKKSKFKEGDLIEAVIFYQGDETGGVFFVDDNGVQLIR